MRLPSRPWIAVGAASLALPATLAFGSAVLSVDHPCYADPSVRSETVQILGNGFAPGSAYHVSLDGVALAGGSGTVAGDGSVRGSLPVPSLDLAGQDKRVHSFLLSVSDGTNTQATSITVSRLVAGFNPSAGDPRTLRVRFFVYGLGLGESPGGAAPPVFIHYVPPGRSRAVKDVRVGVAGDACGAMRHSKQMRLFPVPAKPGLWRLQFDTRPRYTRGTASAGFVYYTVGVRVKR